MDSLIYYKKKEGKFFEASNSLNFDSSPPKCLIKLKYFIELKYLKHR